MTLIVLPILGVLGGGIRHSRFGHAGWLPLAVVVLLVVLLHVTGHLG
jgi:hypothetical protein